VSFVDPLVPHGGEPASDHVRDGPQHLQDPGAVVRVPDGQGDPIASAKTDEKLLNEAYDRVAEALARGELVGIFPEGRITDTGELYPFRGGVKKIIDRTPVPVVPLALKGLWAASSAGQDGKAMAKAVPAGAHFRASRSRRRRPIAPQA
jgi:1-acyl-sn-glycerol-3-phosphate acyltransferase